MSERVSSEELLAYIAKATTEAIQKYHKRRVEPLIERINKLEGVIEHLSQTLDAVLGKVSAISKIEETAIYNATKAVADAKLATNLEKIARELSDSLLSALDINTAVREAVKAMLPTIADTVSKVKVQVDEKSIRDTVTSTLNEFIDKELEPRLSELVTIAEEEKKIMNAIEGLNQSLKELSRTVAKLRQSVENIIVRVGKLEEEVSKITPAVRQQAEERREEKEEEEVY